MKKIFITFAIIIASLSGFSQSFSVDNKSLSVPRYANQAAITAAITAPTTGTLVFDNALGQFAYYNGTSWVNILNSAGVASSNPWTSVGTTTSTTDNVGIGLLNSEVLSNFHVRSTTTNSGFILERRGDIPRFQLLRYGGTPTSPAAVTAGVLGQVDFLGSTSGAPTAFARGANIRARAMENFTSTNNGSQIEFQTAALGGSTQVTRMSISPAGNIGINTETTTAIIDVREVGNNATTAVNPHLKIKSNTTNVIGEGNISSIFTRYEGSMTTQAVVHRVDAGPGATTGNLNWEHYTSAGVVTQLMAFRGGTFTVNGNVHNNGFTRLGGNIPEVPSIKTKLLTGLISATNQLTNFAHGLNATKIISVDIVVATPISYVSGTSNANPSTIYRSYFDATNVVIFRVEDTTTSQLDGSEAKIYVTHTE